MPPWKPAYGSTEVTSRWFSAGSACGCTTAHRWTRLPPSSASTRTVGLNSYSRVIQGPPA